MLGLELLCVALAGAAGAVCRYVISLGTHALLGSAWPWGTLAVNVLGCLAFGAGHQWLRHLPSDPGYGRLLWLTGFCGGLTTFSTLAFDLFVLHERHGLAWAGSNLALHVGLGMAALVSGMALARAW